MLPISVSAPRTGSLSLVAKDHLAPLGGRCDRFPPYANSNANKDCTVEGDCSMPEVVASQLIAPQPPRQLPRRRRLSGYPAIARSSSVPSLPRHPAKSQIAAFPKIPEARIDTEAVLA